VNAWPPPPARQRKRAPSSRLPRRSPQTDRTWSCSDTPQTDRT
jgi:hypothetical protein